MDRRQVMVATSSVGPGALNMVTAAGLAHANRLPLLLLPGDTFTGRAPDPVLQQVEHFGDGTVGGNDAFRPVPRYFDRITRPEQLLSSLPQVARVLTDPADAGPVVIALPQGRAGRGVRLPGDHVRPSVASRAAAASGCRRPCRGGRDPACGKAAAAHRRWRGALLPDPHPRNAGALGTIGSASANALAADADVVIAVGTRLQDFTTSSWSLFSDDVRLVTINAARFDAVKHAARALPPSARPGTPTSTRSARESHPMGH